MTIEQERVIKETIAFVKETLTGAEGGHDWFHIERVWKLSTRINETEKADPFIIQLGALLHDIADSKFHHGNENIGPEKARKFLKSLEVEEKIIEHVVNIISNISFKGGNIPQKFHSSELDIIQDADRLDALGAVGIARTFNYGGFIGRPLYDPAIKPDLNMTKEDYKASVAPTINHFYEKLLLLKDRMNTATAKKMAQKRHDFIEIYLNQFYKEWKGEI